MKKNVLILIDIQQEYTTPGRPFYLNGIEPSLENCRTMLDFAREHDWEIVHVQHSKGPTADRFNPDTVYFNFVEGFEPLADEKHVIKNSFSCYSSDEFSLIMDQLYQSEDEINAYVIGYNSVMCCLSTLEEAMRKGHKMSLVRDATYAKTVIEGMNEADMHKVMLGIYQAKGLSTLVRTEDVLAMPRPAHFFSLR